MPKREKSTVNPTPPNPSCSLQHSTLQTSFAISISLSLLFILSILISPISSQSDCSFHGAHITLGDKFSPSVDSSVPTHLQHIFTVGISTDRECESGPPILHLRANGEADEHRIGKDTEYTIKENAGATRINYFFKIIDEDTHRYTEWVLKYKERNITAWSPLPQRHLFNTLRTHKVIVVSNTDMTDINHPMHDIFDKMNENEYELLLHIGDFFSDGDMNLSTARDEFSNIISPTTRRMPYIVAPGKIRVFKDDVEEFIGLESRHKMANSKGSEESMYHYFDVFYKNAYYVCIDFEYIAQDPENDKKVFEWLQERVKIAVENTSLRWRILVVQHPLFCADLERFCSSMPYYSIKYEDLLAKYGFDVVLSGQPAIYARTTQFRALKSCPSQDGKVAGSNYDKVGKGCLMQIISGRSGDGAYFGDESVLYENDSSLVEKISDVGPTYLVIEFSHKYLQADLYKASNGEKVDSFKIYKEAPNTSHLIYMFIGIICFMAFLLLCALFAMWLKFRKGSELIDASLGSEDTGSHLGASIIGDNERIRFSEEPEENKPHRAYPHSVPN